MWPCRFVSASVSTLTQWIYWLWCHQENVGDALSTTCSHGGASSDPSGSSLLMNPSLAQVPTKAPRIIKSGCIEEDPEAQRWSRAQL